MSAGRSKEKLILTAVLCLLIPACTSDQSPQRLQSSAADSQPEESIAMTPSAAAEIPNVAEIPGSIRFTNILDQSGIDFVHTSGNSPEKPFPAANGSGLSSLDYDLDGQYDLYFGNGANFPLSDDHSTISDRFYRNVRNWKFSDVTAVSGLGMTGYTAGIATGDFNNDGLPDLYVTSFGRNRLYCNYGDGTFGDASAESGTDDSRWATSAAFLDFNNDGQLDIYVCNYGKWTFETNPFCGDPVRKVRMFCSPTMVPPEPDVLFRNQGDGTFLDVSEATGINVRTGRGQGVLAADLNADHQIDLYVANDINPNFLLLNDGQGHFQESGESSGTAYDHLGQAQAGMGLAIGDIDRNGHLDLFVTNYQREHNALYENLGNGVFMETGTTRVPEGSLPFVGWGTACTDFDLDGWPDLIVTNGHTDDNLALLGKEGVYLQPPGLWKNHEGRFKFAALSGGEYFEGLHNGRGLLTADLDNDRDADVVITHQDNRPAVLRNDLTPEARDHAVQLFLIGVSCNRDAIGAVVEIESADPPMVQTVFGGGSYGSGSDRRVVSGTEGHDVVTIRITWPDGTMSVCEDLKSGNTYTILQAPRSDVSPRWIPYCED